MQGVNAAGFEAALNATQRAHDTLWGRVDPEIVFFSHQTSPVDHETPEARWHWIAETAALRVDLIHLVHSILQDKARIFF